MSDLTFMKNVRLSNGVEMPLLGYGVFLVKPEECCHHVTEALKAGYRLIDTAQAYANEQGVGEAVRRSGIDRKDIFITTKIWISNYGEEKTARSIDESLQRLQTDYIDLLLLHQAYNDVFGAWRAMEKAYRAGKVRAIGVSNFQLGRFFDFAHYVEVKPMVNQLQCNALMQQRGIEPQLDEFGCRMMAWAPLGQGGDEVLNNPVLKVIGARYGKTAAQVALRWLIQRGIIAIPKTVNPERMAQNIDIFDFELNADDMAAIETMNQNDVGNRAYTDPAFLKYLIERFADI